MEWPACFPDMNLIEHVWDDLGRRVAGSLPPPQTLQEMERAILEEWDRISQLVINSLIDPMPQRRKKHPIPLQLSKKIAQDNLTASCKRFIAWFLLDKVTELCHKTVPVRPPKF
ncbi:transposable element Tcb2 transposase [Trichonephila clavipes]|nr:transposable element Tcb2 transposase [Trichonephila clavipes]